MPDVYISDKGDIDVAPNGDISMVQTIYQHYSQQAYIRMMTEMGDFPLYPGLGASLQLLVGMPNTVETGEYGRELILSALAREGALSGLTFNVKAIPISYTSIRFDVYIIAGSRTELILSIEQNLTLQLDE